jgi:N-acetylglucosamine-6-sulfatase
MSDDHSAEAVGFRGARARLSAHSGTTHIDRLAAEGAYVEDMFVALSLCSPSRASIMTGLHAHAHGVTQLSGAMRSAVNGGRTYVDELVARGYRSALVGKVSQRIGGSWGVEEH